ncbi:isochorismate synthase MenF [Brucellaceae bacterium D45D]
MNAPARKMPTASVNTDNVPLFAFHSRNGTLTARGEGSPVPRGNVSTLAERISTALRGAGIDTIIAGALPFDRSAPDYLWQTSDVIRTPLATSQHWPDSHWQLRPEPDAKGYAEAVRRALDIMASEAGQPDALAKIVLSRSLVATAEHAIDLNALLARLSVDPAVMAFLVPLPPRNGHPRTLAGATPELLFSKTGTSIASHPLAGSAKRRPDLAEDAAAAAGLGRSVKDRDEHNIVVEFILDTLAPYCRNLTRPEGTALVSTRSMWHLGTRIEGELKDADIPAIVLAAALHPTPAVCGLPRERAAGLIRDLEPHDRDFYAGTVGWCDGRGNGSWYVTIRCAEICRNQARLYAGAGIVPQSDPASEAAETGAKFGALLAALGISAFKEERV